MTVRTRILAAGTAVALLFAGGLRAEEDIASLRSEVADMTAKVAAMESAQMAPAVGGDGESLTSIKKTGAIKIGGDVNVDVIVKHREDVNAGDRVDSTEFHTNSANLRFKIEASRDSYLYIKLDLDDAWDDSTGRNVVNQDDLLEEAKYVFNHVAGSDFGFVFGKGEVPYGQDRTLGVLQSYHHNDTAAQGANRATGNNYTSEGPVFLLDGSEEVENAHNSHGTVGPTWHPGEVDNVFMLAVNYTYKGLFMAEFAVFQNNDTTGLGRSTRGMHEDRADDSLFFQSMAMRLWATPMEGLTVEASAIKKHIDSFGDKDAYGNDAEADEYAVSLGFDYKVRNLPIGFFGEYEHGWDWAYTDGYHTDTTQLGFTWDVTQKIQLGLMGEWLAIDYNAQGIDDDWFKAVASAKYQLDSGVFFILEYAHEWFDGERNNVNNEREADMIAFRTGWAF